MAKINCKKLDSNFINEFLKENKLSKSAFSKKYSFDYKALKNILENEGLVTSLNLIKLGLILKTDVEKFFIKN